MPMIRDYYNPVKPEDLTDEQKEALRKLGKYVSEVLFAPPETDFKKLAGKPDASR